MHAAVGLLQMSVYTSYFVIPLASKYIFDYVTNMYSLIHELL